MRETTPRRGSPVAVSKTCAETALNCEDAWHRSSLAAYLPWTSVQTIGAHASTGRCVSSMWPQTLPFSGRALPLVNKTPPAWKVFGARRWSALSAVVVVSAVVSSDCRHDLERSDSGMWTMRIWHDQGLMCSAATSSGGLSHAWCER